LILLDANALISVVLAEPAAFEVVGLLRSDDCGVPVPCVAEVRDQLIRRHAITEEEFWARTGPLVDVGVVGLPVDIEVARWAGDIRAEYYSRSGAALSLADCLLLASAAEGDQIATADAAVIRVARALDVGVIPLLDSRGRRPD
jgi:predicted nucleic acid-binding protein